LHALNGYAKHFVVMSADKLLTYGRLGLGSSLTSALYL